MSFTLTGGDYKFDNDHDDHDDYDGVDDVSGVHVEFKGETTAELYKAELKRSPIWKYFILRPERETMHCKICLCSYHSVKSTTAERHLKTKHSNVYEIFNTTKERWMKLRVLHRHITKNGIRKWMVWWVRPLSRVVFNFLPLQYIYRFFHVDRVVLPKLCPKNERW